MQATGIVIGKGKIWPHGGGPVVRFDEADVIDPVKKTVRFEIEMQDGKRVARNVRPE